MLRADAIPGDVRALFEEAGIRRGSYWVLDLGDSPEDRRMTGLSLGMWRWRAASR